MWRIYGNWGLNRTGTGFLQMHGCKDVLLASGLQQRGSSIDRGSCRSPFQQGFYADLFLRDALYEMLELRYREEVLSREQEGWYPRWNELSDQRLTEALLMLREDERCFIYQHVFEERTFKEISCLNEVKEDKVKSIYYYAIHKSVNGWEVTDDGIWKGFI